MRYIHLSVFLGIALFLLCRRGLNARRDPLLKSLPALLFFAALAVRLFFAARSMGFNNDTACFASWADRIFQEGPRGFYSGDVFTDYPPGYLYLLWIPGALRNILGIEYYSMAHMVLLKILPILCDLTCGMLLFREASRRCTREQAFAFCAAYLFNPAILLNSSVWGQADSVFTLAVVILCLSLVQGKMYPAYLAFGVGLLIKPQTLLFAPVLFAGAIDHVFPEKGSDAAWLRRAGQNFLQGLSVIAGMLLLCLPFGLEAVWKQYFGTVASYPYAAVNASNFWGLLGLNWVSQDNTFLGIPYYAFGFAAIAASVAFVLFLSLKNRGDSEKYPFLSALLILSIFTFSVRMHERYMYPGLILLLLAYLYKPAEQLYLCYGIYTVLHFYNTAGVLFFYDPVNYDRKASGILAVSAGIVACTVFLYTCAYQLYGAKSREVFQWQAKPAPASKKTERSAMPTDYVLPRASEARVPLKRADVFCMLAVTFAYACFALYDLGDRQAPVSAYDMEGGQSIELDFGSEAPSSLSSYIAPWHDRSFTLEGKKEEGGEWEPMGEIFLPSVFTWQTAAIEGEAVRLRLTLKDTQASLLEFVFLNRNGETVTPVNAADYPTLFDEGSLFPEVGSFRNSMYFDEIYHGRTAYEFLNGLTSYENTHPPLGKILIALGVAVFGMNPFGWRIVGVLFGIAMVPVVYLFARKLLKGTLPAALACVLFAFDFMHFAQTRLATIDVYITFFVMLMYYFMYQYACLSFYDTSLKKTWIPLGACGVCMGLGIASKWTGIYAGCGLAIIFFSVLYRRYQEYLYARKHPNGRTDGISHREILKNFAPYAGRTILFCLVFFIAIPALIYLLSYIPFRDYEGRGLFARVFYNQSSMFSYHSQLNATHDFSSPWHEWPIMKRPVWYYSRIVTQTAQGGGIREGISSFGNPAVWWVGIPAFFYTAYLWAKKKDRTAAFLTVGYLAQYLPWFFVTRITFIYHYFPSVVFVVLMNVYSIRQRQRRFSKRTFLFTAIVYSGAAVALFLLFYPVLSGHPVDAAFVDEYLRWSKGWVFTA